MLPERFTPSLLSHPLSLFLSHSVASSHISPPSKMHFPIQLIYTLNSALRQSSSATCRTGRVECLTLLPFECGPFIQIHPKNHYFSPVGKSTSMIK